MKKLLLACLLLGMLLATSAAYADQPVGGTWEVYPSDAVLDDQNALNGPYWGGNSDDADTLYTVGHFLTKTGGFASDPRSPGLVAPQWLGDGSGNQVSFYMVNSNEQQAALVIEVAGLANNNKLGWYDVNDLAGGLLPTELNEIFNGSAAEGAVSAIFTPSANYGFYFTSGNGLTFLTQYSDGSSADNSYQHFALFKGLPNSLGDTYWFGVEDLPYSGSDKDYNDMVFHVYSVPEPGTLLLIGSSMVGMMGLGFRRRRRS